MELLERKLLKLYALMGNMKAKLAREDGATAVEYGLIVALIAAVVIGTVLALGGRINSAFCTILTALGGSAAGCAP